MGDIIPTKIEELKSSDVQKVKGLAGIFTELRKFLYLFFSIGSAAALFGVSALVGANQIIQIIILVFLIIYSMFKIRDYARGKI